MVGCDPKNLHPQGDTAGRSLSIYRQTSAPCWSWRHSRQNALGRKWFPRGHRAQQYENSVHFGALLFHPTARRNRRSRGAPRAAGIATKFSIELSRTIPAGGTPPSLQFTVRNAQLVDSIHKPGSPHSSFWPPTRPQLQHSLPFTPACSCSYSTPEYRCTNYPATCFFVPAAARRPHAFE
jgi:hypothetical protein